MAWKPNEKQLQIIERLLKKRASTTSIAKALGVSRRTYYNAKNSEPFFSQIAQITQRIEDDRVRDVEAELDKLKSNVFESLGYLSTITEYEEEKVATKPFTIKGEPIPDPDKQGEYLMYDEVTVTQKRIMPNANTVQFLACNLLKEHFQPVSKVEKELLGDSENTTHINISFVKPENNES